MDIINLRQDKSLRDFLNFGDKAEGNFGHGLRQGLNHGFVRDWILGVRIFGT